MKKRISGLFTVSTLVLAIAAVGSISSNAQTFSALYNFNDNTSDPLGFVNPGTLAQGPDGNVYSTSVSGGAIVGGEGANGTVFNMTPAGLLSELYSFEVVQGNPAIGCNPYSGVTLGTDGNFFGTTIFKGMARLV